MAGYKDKTGLEMAGYKDKTHNKIRRAFWT